MNEFQSAIDLRIGEDDFGRIDTEDDCRRSV